MSPHENVRAFVADGGRGTLVIEVKGAAAPIPSLALALSQRGVRHSVASLDVTIPQPPLQHAGLHRLGDPVAEHFENKAYFTGKRTFVSEIARGGMGQIYFGEDPQLKRQVEVKVSSVAYGGEDPGFSKEEEVLEHLAHPNIVPISNIGVDAQSRPTVHADFQ